MTYKCLFCVWLYADETVLYFIADSVQLPIKKLQLSFNVILNSKLSIDI